MSHETPSQPPAEHDHLACPGCGRRYPLGSDMDYCEVDGERLVTRHVTSPTVPDAEPAAANHPPEPAPATAPEDNSLMSRLHGVLSQMGLRRRHTPPPSATRPVAAPAAPENPLPDELRELGWHLNGPLESTPAADAWPVVCEGEAGLTPMQARFTRYRAQAITGPALYTHLQTCDSPALPTVLQAGTVSLHGARASYDLTALRGAGRLAPLTLWLEAAVHSEQKALALLPHLVQLLVDLEAAGVRPVSLRPSELLRDDATGALCLSSVGYLTEATPGSAHLPDYRPELERNSGLLSHHYSAPELFEQLVVSPNSPIFSVGQILMLAYLGKPFELSDLRAGHVPFSLVHDPRLARVLMGCCWAGMQGRWRLEQLQEAVQAPLDQLPPTLDWSSLGPRAMGRSFALGGGTWWRVEDAVTQTIQPQHWAESRTRLEALLDWMEASPWAGTAQHLRDELRRGRSADWVLVRLAHTVCPSTPLTWQHLDMSDTQARNSLVSLAQAALQNQASARACVDALFAADLRGAFQPTAGASPTTARP